MSLIAATLLTLSAALWRFLDGRGIPPKTTVRNAVGLSIALLCSFSGILLGGHNVGLWNAAAMSGCAILAWATLVLGHTRWESWWSVARYGGPTCAIATLACLGGAPVIACALYSLGGVLVGVLYVVLHRYLPFRYSTAVCEVAAGGVIVGGLSWLGRP